MSYPEYLNFASQKYLNSLPLIKLDDNIALMKKPITNNNSNKQNQKNQFKNTMLPELITLTILFLLALIITINYFY